MYQSNPNLPVTAGLDSIRGGGHVRVGSGTRPATQGQAVGIAAQNGVYNSAR